MRTALADRAISRVSMPRRTAIGVRVKHTHHAGHIGAGQVVARVAPQDYEWSTRPVVAVVAALLMDIGMLRVPAAVLAKAGPLDPDERRQVDAHPEAGAAMVRNVLPELGLVAEAAAAHHERPDGTGYPHSKSGEDVPSLARMLAVCDAYAAMACDRPRAEVACVPP